MKLRNVLFTGILLIIGFLPLFGQDGDLQVSPDSGTYTWNQVVSITCDEEYKILYSFGNNSTDPDIPYSEPFLLSALPSEERQYKLNVALLKDDMIIQRQEFEYTIDLQAPRPPFLTIPEGVYNHPVTVNLQSQSEAQVVYSLGGSETSPLRVWRGEPILLSGRENGDNVYKLSAYSVDPAGNKSTVENWGFRITTPGVQESSLKILSPVEGNFRNLQMLYLKERGYRWIRFTTNGADPVLSGNEYSGPVLIRHSGDITLKIAAMPLNGAEAPENYTVEFTAGDEYLENAPDSGSYSSTLNFRASDLVGYYCLAERSPEFPDPEFTGDIKLHSIPQGYRSVPMRIKTEDEENAEFRYFYILDNRYPADPVILSRENSPLTSRTQITLEGSDFSTMYYTLDGTSPDLNSEPYNAPFLLNIPDESSTGSIIVKARAFSKNGNVSAETSRLFTYNRAVPDTPVPAVYQDSSNSEALINVQPPSAGNQVLYEISQEADKLKTLNRNSPIFPGEVILDVPSGQSTSFFMVFASKDSAGNLSEPTEVLEIKIDKRSNIRPLIEHRDGFVYLYGPENLYYSLSLRDRLNDSTEFRGIKYMNPFQLHGNDNEKTILNVSAWVEDEAGVKGPASSKRIVIPGTIPNAPGYYGIESEGIYNDKTVILYITTPGENEAVHYNYAMGEIPVPEINEDSPIASDNLFFTGMPGEISRYHLVMKTRNLVTGQFSEPVELFFTMDLDPPLIPLLTGIEDQAVYSGDVFLSVPDDVEDSVFISFTYFDQTPGDPFGENGGRLFKEKRFSVPDGISRKIFYRIGTEDIAGNRTRGEELHWFVIDNTTPDIPDVAGVPEQGLTSSAVTLLLSQLSRDIIVHYEVSYNGRVPSEINDESPVFDPEGLYFKGTDGLKTPVILRYKARNLAGTWSDDENLLYFVIDRMAPVERGELQFQVMEDLKKFVLSWDVGANQELFFRIPELGDDFLLFNEPVTLDFPDGKDNLTVESYVTDRAGNSSGMQVKSIRFPFLRDGELVGGYPESNLTNNLVRLFRIESSGLIRYEIATGDEEPGSVNRFSPVFPKSMDLDAGNGERIEYSMKIRSFSGIGAGGAGTEQVIDFTIDKTKPLAPVIEGIADGEHYQEDLVITFPNGDSDIYYALQKGFREDNHGFPDFELYTKPHVIESKEGTFDTYRIYAYRKDRAGNQSEIKDWEFYIDREIIYISPNGNDLNGGTRSRPFKSLEKAVAYSEVTGRNTVFMSGGNYEVNETIIIPDELNIFGGFDELSWEPSENIVSTIQTGEFFPADRPVFLIAGKGVFKDLRVAIEGDSASAVIQQEGGDWKLENTEISISESSIKTPIEVFGGKLTLIDSLCSGDRFQGESLLSSSGGTIILESCKIMRSESTRQSLLLSAKEGSTIKVLGTLFSPGSARSTMSIKSVDSDIWIDEQSEIMTGDGSIDAIALHSKDSDITILNSTIENMESGRVVQGIFCENSEIILQDSYLDLSAEVGVVGIQANNSRFLIMGNTLKAKADDFIYIIRTTASSGRGINNYLHGDETADLKGLVIEGGGVSLFHNTMIFRSGEGKTVGIKARNGRELNIINNIIVSDNPGQNGTGIEAENFAVRIQGNNLHGWQTVYKKNVPYITVDELNLSDLSHAGGPMNANIDEGPEKSFSDKFALNPHLRRNSACINGGVDISLQKDLSLDWDRETRPNPDDGIRPQADMGADEYYQE
ncbi:MAG: chitobiase/beta-hexosaminidase C-terminal domain-containing protein [Spirochaetales bacterium]|nr:chitobiase/beta-hexosaminidase C-terminal domain-containing protein [Spirochaetales bacterium]